MTERRDRTNNAIILVINWTTFFYSFSFEWFVRVFWFEWVAIQKERWTTLQFENAPNETEWHLLQSRSIQKETTQGMTLSLSLSVSVALRLCVFIQNWFRHMFISDLVLLLAVYFLSSECIWSIFHLRAHEQHWLPAKPHTEHFTHTWCVLGALFSIAHIDVVYKRWCKEFTSTEK